MAKLKTLVRAFQSHPNSLVGTFFILCSVCIELLQPHVPSSFEAGQPAIYWLDWSRMGLSLGGAALLLWDAFANVRISITMQNEISHLKKVISQHATKQDLDRIKQD